MSNIYGQIQQMSPARGSDGSAGMLRSTRDGALYITNWYLALALEGRAFAANAGTGTTPVTLRPVYAVAEPDLAVSAPASLAVIPVHIFVAAEDTGTALVSDILAAASSTIATPTGGTTLTVRGMRMDIPIASGVTAVRTATAAGDITAGNYVEFWRPIGGFVIDNFNVSAAQTGPNGEQHQWSVRDCRCPPLLAAGGTFEVFQGYQAGIGWTGAVWVELPTSAIV